MYNHSQPENWISSPDLLFSSTRQPVHCSFVQNYIYTHASVTKSVFGVTLLWHEETMSVALALVGDSSLTQIHV